MKARSDWKHLLGIFVVALLLRLGAVVWFEQQPPPILSDEAQYLHLARLLASSSLEPGTPRYQSPRWQRLLDAVAREQSQKKSMLQIGDQKLFSGNTPGSQRFMQHVPLYPLVISSVIRLTGDHHLMRTIRIIQVFIGTASVLMVYLVGTHFFEGRGRLWAAWLAAIYPAWIYFTGLVLTETLFVLLLLVCWYLAVRIAQRPTATDIVMCGLFASAAVLTKGSALGLFVVLLPVLLIVTRSHLRMLGAAVGLVVVVAIGISPWVAHNYIITRTQNDYVGKSDRGDLVLTTCSVGRSLYEAVGPEADGGPAMDRIAVPTKLAPMTEHDVDRYYMQEARNSIRENPGRFFKLALTKLSRTWNIVPNYSGYRRPLHMIVSVASVLPLVVLALAGWWFVRGEVRGWMLLLLPVVYFTALHMIFVGSVRYRMPVMGFLMILAGVALSRALGRIRGQQEPEPESGS